MEQKLAKKYVVVEAGWDVKADPFVWVDGPFNNYEDAKNDFDAKLMMQLGMDPNDDEYIKEYQRSKCSKADKYDDYDDRYLLSIQVLENE